MCIICGWYYFHIYLILVGMLVGGGVEGGGEERGEKMFIYTSI